MYRKTFSKAGALAYLGEAGAHVLILCSGFRLVSLPFIADWFFAVLGSYCAVGLLVFARKLRYRGAWDRFLHGLITLHILISVALHLYIIITGSHAILLIFKQWYSFIGLAYCLCFAYWLWRVQVSNPGA